MLNPTAAARLIRRALSGCNVNLRLQWSILARYDECVRFLGKASVIAAASAVAAIARGQPLPGTNPSDAKGHCSVRDMCPTGVACSTEVTRAEPSIAYHSCSRQALKRGWVRRCSANDGLTLRLVYCPPGKSGAWVGSAALAKADLEPDASEMAMTAASAEDGSAPAIDGGQDRKVMPIATGTRRDGCAGCAESDRGFVGVGALGVVGCLLLATSRSRQRQKRFRFPER